MREGSGSGCPEPLKVLVPPKREETKMQGLYRILRVVPQVTVAILQYYYMVYSSLEFFNEDFLIMFSWTLLLSPFISPLAESSSFERPDLVMQAVAPDTAMLRPQ